MPPDLVLRVLSKRELRPRGVSEPHPPFRGVSVGIASLRYLIARAGDDPTTADVTIGVPLWGIGSLLRLSAGEWLMALGRQVTEEALPNIKAALD